MRPGSRCIAGTDKGVVVGAHPWVYAATQPRYDIYPILDQIFADVAYAGIDGIELMHTALRPARLCRQDLGTQREAPAPGHRDVVRGGDVGPLQA